MLYSRAYHPQTHGSSKQTNQTIEIALRFFVYGLDNSFIWPIAPPAIQSIINNTSSLTTGKTPNKIAYGFNPCRFLDLLSALPSPSIATIRIESVNAIFFAMANQKTYSDRKHQPLFMKKGKWAILCLHKGYSIPATLGMTKKLTQQYVGQF